MPYFDLNGNRIEVTMSSGFTGSIYNDRVYPINNNIHPQPSYQRRIQVSENLLNFVNKSSSNYSSACFTFKYYISGELDSHSIDIIDRALPKINTISESDDGYIIINGNQKVKLGKFIVKISDELKINTNDKKEATFIENYVDQYKSWYKTISSLKFKMLKGEQILKGYDYSSQANNHGMLRGSCMNDKFHLLDLYVDNEEKVELLVLVDEEDKIYGRAFIWNIDNQPFIFMDRVYGVDNYVTHIFNDYARSVKMAYREQNQTTNFEMYLPNGESTTSERSPLMVRLYSKHLKFMPYMDSLYIWNEWNSTFSTSKNVQKNMKYHILKDTRGNISKPGIKILGLKIKSEG